MVDCVDAVGGEFGGGGSGGFAFNCCGFGGGGISLSACGAIGGGDFLMLVVVVGLGLTVDDRCCAVPFGMFMGVVGLKRYGLGDDVGWPVACVFVGGAMGC